jgi:hypothetical protein
LTQKVIGSCEGLDYGVWASLSEKSFLVYFGWLSNWLPDYEYSGSIPMNVETGKGNQRPDVIPHEDPNHPFVQDYFAGISLKEGRT